MDLIFEHRLDFAHFLRNGFELAKLLGLPFDDVKSKMSIPKHAKMPEFGLETDWFQDLSFWFDENGNLISIELLLTVSPHRRGSPCLLNYTWFESASKFVPNVFEKFLIEEKIPCLRTSTEAGSIFIPPIYILDRVGMMPRFDKNKEHLLESIDMRLMRDFPRANYVPVWPRELGRNLIFP